MQMGVVAIRKSSKRFDSAFALRSSEFEALIDDWERRAEERRRAENAEMVDRLISEHRAERRGAAPSELLDS